MSGEGGGDVSKHYVVVCTRRPEFGCGGVERVSGMSLYEVCLPAIDNVACVRACMFSQINVALNVSRCPERLGILMTYKYRTS